LEVNVRVLTVAAQKGGAGKTTLAASLAVAAAQDGEAVVAIDLDPQRSLTEWGERRQVGDIAFRPVDVAGLADLLERIQTHGRATLCLIDTPGAFDETVITALKHSELCLLPVRPSILDVNATRRTAEALRDLGRRFAFVLSQVQATSAARAEDAAEALVAIGPLFPGFVGLRADHLDAMLMGQGVSEWRPRGPAAAEIRDLWNWLKNKLNEERSA
jgi:chromosome partitioning protein